tara:strand:- start:347 stop:664 length:318 start_codon:yes stop_codon:yes gene_type:complete
MIQMGNEPWLDWVHAAEVLVDLDYTADTPHMMQEFAWNYATRHQNVQPVLKKAYELGTAVRATRTAVSLGIAIGAMDGPLPFADILGFGVAAAGTVYAWYDFLVD